MQDDTTNYNTPSYLNLKVPPARLTMTKLTAKLPPTRAKQQIVKINVRFASIPETRARVTRRFIGTLNNEEIVARTSSGTIALRSVPRIGSVWNQSVGMRRERRDVQYSPTASSKRRKL